MANNTKQKYTREQIERLKSTPEPFIYFFFNLMFLKNEVAFFPVRQGNGDFLALCPLHKERTPSLRIWAAKKRKHIGEDPTWLFKCFGCGQSGDVMTLMSRVQRISFLETLCVMKRDARLQKYFSDPINSNQLKLELK